MYIRRQVDPNGLPEQRRAIVAGIAGNVMEWYNFSVYGYFAAVIGQQFFPARDLSAGRARGAGAPGAAAFGRRRMHDVFLTGDYIWSAEPPAAVRRGAKMPMGGARRRSGCRQSEPRRSHRSARASAL
jgi:hypothetical protein